jgi:hypothetical protein
MRNIFEAIERFGHDEDFQPQDGPEFVPTDAPPGTYAKLDVLIDRVRKGFPLWHPRDRRDLSGIEPSILGTKRGANPCQE